ncbi:MAG: ABC transporter ATP-binding protein [Aerococcus sp.]|nr:ABC transporter ATP-binding protein [Aerococcus sp.]
MSQPNKQVHFSFREQLTILKLLFSFAKPYWRLFLLAFMGTIIDSAVIALRPVVVQQYIDRQLTSGQFQFQATPITAALYLGLTFVDVIVFYYRTYAFSLASEKSVKTMRDRLYTQTTRFGLRFFDQVPNGTVVSRVTNDTETIKEFWRVFQIAVENVTMVGAIAVAMFALYRPLAWAFMGFVPILILLVYVYQRYSTVVYGNMRQALSRLNVKLSEGISGMAIIQQFHQQHRMQQEFDEVNQAYVKWRKRMFAMNALLLMPAVNLLETIALVIVLGLFGVRVLDGQVFDVGILYAFVSYSRSFFSPIGDMMDSLSVYQDGLVSGSRVGELLKQTASLAPTSHPDAEGRITQGKVEIKNLNFSYDGKEDVLHNINVVANPGETIAFVGQTGSGKSSIINVLMRFYEYHSGAITIDDQDLRDIEMSNLRQQIGLVLQDSFMFYGDVMSNIRLHGSYQPEEVAEAAHFVHANQFIEDLDGKYEAEVIEGGKAFSTGEKQLLSFARTILREPKILILDEATANIDTETEQLIQSGLKNMRRGRTTIIIAHRLSTIKDADRIYVLRQGHIIESGTHDELIDQKGYYYDMY